MTEIKAEAAVTTDEDARTHSHTHSPAATTTTTAGATTPDKQYWDDRYGQSERMWSGNPNTALVREVSDLPPGHALDLGCGEGADAIWLAGRGWHVTAVDVSQVAIDRAAVHAGAAGAGVAERIEWQVHDLSTSVPAGSFDLVSAQFLYFRSRDPRAQALQAAAAAVAPGGILLIEGHAGLPASADHPYAGIGFPTPEQTLAALNLAEGEWEILVCAEHERAHNHPGGKSAAHTDSTVKVRRLTS